MEFCSYPGELVQCYFVVLRWPRCQTRGKSEYQSLGKLSDSGAFRGWLRHCDGSLNLPVCVSVYDCVWTAYLSVPEISVPN